MQGNTAKYKLRIAQTTSDPKHLFLNEESKGNFSLCLIKHHVVNTYEGMEVQLHAFLTSDLE
jgi:hypothetical protein